MSRRLNQWRNLQVRVIALAAAASFLIASIGYPVWSAHEPKDLSQPFPCMHRECGCKNAAQCWQGCCCFTNREKLAWAKEHHVQPPEYVAKAAAAESQAKPALAGCCSLKKATSCCAKNPSGKSTRQAPVTYVSYFQSLTCHGHVDQWVAIGAVSLPPIDDFEIEVNICGTLCVLSQSCDSPAFTPTSPPPWC